MSDTDIPEAEPATIEGEYTFPGSLRVLPNDDTESGLPPEYITIEISTPISEQEYYFKTTDFDCPLHPNTTNAVCIYYDDEYLVSVYDTHNDGHIEVRQHLKDKTVSIERFTTPVADQETYIENDHVVWTAPQTDAAIIEN